MMLRQFLHDDSDSISYMFSCCDSGLAVVVDPIGDIRQYLRAVREAGARIKFVINTHVHDDHLSSACALSLREGAEHVLSARAEVPFLHKEVHEGDVLSLGTFDVTVLEMPGDATENIALLIVPRGAREPFFLLAGHSLAREFRASLTPNEIEERARDLFRSIQKLKRLPDRLEILPGVQTRTVYARRLPCSTIGFERLRNKAMRIESEDEFVEFIIAENGSFTEFNATAKAPDFKSAPRGGQQ